MMCDAPVRLEVQQDALRQATGQKAPHTKRDAIDIFWRQGRRQEYLGHGGILLPELSLTLVEAFVSQESNSRLFAIPRILEAW